MDNKENLGYMLVGAGIGMVVGYILYDLVMGSEGSDKDKEKKKDKRKDTKT